MPPERSHSTHGLLIPGDQIPIVFLTVCTRGRKRWAANDRVHKLLVQTWKGATSCFVGRYVMMPDRIHALVAPSTESLPLENWVTYWKSQFTKSHQVVGERWQTDHGDTRLRSWESYDQKWDYVRMNSVRHGLVDDPRDWPYQGERNELRWD